MHSVETPTEFTPTSAEVADAGEAYTVRQVARLFGVPQRRLRYWAQTGFIRPSIRLGAKMLYSFRDLIAVKVARSLLEGGVPLRRVRRSLGRLAVNLPQLDTSLSSLRVRCEGDDVVVDQADHRFEAATGQLLIDFDLETLRDEARQIVALPLPAGDAEPSTAYQWFLRGCELEDDWGGAPTDIEGFEAARHAYERALEQDGDLAAAWTNLGSMHAEIGDLAEARRCFDRALACDPEQPEAHCNVAELALREGEIEAAIEGFRQVLRLDPDCAQAHYGLGRALLRVGGRAQALAHLERFCVHSARESEGDPELKHRVERARAVVERLREAVGAAKPSAEDEREGS